MVEKEGFEQLKLQIQEEVIQNFAPSYFFADQELPEKRNVLIARIEELLEFRGRDKKVPLVLPVEDKERLIKEIVDEILGYGPIDDLMKDEAVTEIMINGCNKIYAEKKGKKFLTKIKFKNITQLQHLVQKLVSFSGRKVDEATPFVDSSLGDGTRINVIIPPLALEGPIVTIRRMSGTIAKIEDLIKVGTLSREAGEFLIACVRAKINMIFSGPTGTGKTTTLGVLSYYIDPDERIVVIEDTVELNFSQQHVVRLQARLANTEGRGAVTIRDLLKNSLRMSPDRIVIGEVRGGEALDMLQAMASGHRGALGVIHAASPTDVVSRLETMIATSGVNIPLWTIRKHIANNLNLIVQQERLQDGSRKVTHITEVRGLKDEEVTLEDIFTFVQEGFDEKGVIKGKIKATGIVPLCLANIEKKGIKINPELFLRQME
ncbi:MAG: ATPase, T2SS/T4P/T4SS family [Candidatus Omnitrophota bacterium]